MNVILSEPAEKQYKKLPKTVKEKVKKQFGLLAENPRHPSLRIKKMKSTNLYEGRISIHYRFRFIWKMNKLRSFQ
jgi:mRNA interferase RelE/StbE